MGERNSNDESPGNRVQMSGATFDTLKFAETLEEAGIPETHARAISNAVRNAHDTTELATKTDLREAVSELRAEMQALRSETRSDLQTSQTALQSDMQRLESSLQAEMQRLESGFQVEMQRLESGSQSGMQRLDSRIDRLELQLTVRLGGLVVVALGGFAALSKWVA